MNIARFLIMCIFLPSSICLADRQLERAEILKILQSLTAQQSRTWIPAGIITATHEEYKTVADSNQMNSRKEFKLSSNETVRFDGERFYWQIDAEPEHNSQQSSGFDFYGNAKRIFAWDGQKYSTYYRPVNLAIINDADKLKIPPAVNGPLTAGIIPWGSGIYSYQTLSSALVSGTETVSDDQRQIQMNFNLLDGTEMIFILDPEKNYATLSHRFRNSFNLIRLTIYGNFQLIGNKWLPRTIMIEQYNNSIAPENLRASDLWNFTSISADTTADDCFEINYQNDALIEYHTHLAPKSLIYAYYKAISDFDKLSSDSLLLEKFDFDAQTGFSHNCASAAMKYTASRLGKKVGSDQLAAISQDTSGTTLYAIKQFCENLGLYCRAIKTDIQSLKKFTNCEVILHIPDKNHYVVLGNIDDSYVRVIDLSERKFFNHFSISDFRDEWAQGIALVISAQPVNLELSILDNFTLKNIFGTGYSCSRLLQHEGFSDCGDAAGVICAGTYMELYERWGCAPDVSGTCTMSLMPRYSEMQCIPNSDLPGDCKYSNIWKIHYMRACD